MSSDFERELAEDWEGAADGLDSECEELGCEIGTALCEDIEIGVSDAMEFDEGE